MSSSLYAIPGQAVASNKKAASDMQCEWYVPVYCQLATAHRHTVVCVDTMYTEP